jgi:hypothetical protein
MPINKYDLYTSLWVSCDELRGGMDASQYKARAGGSSPVPPTKEKQGVTVETVAPSFCLTGSACHSAYTIDPLKDISRFAFAPHPRRGDHSGWGEGD